jgi:hypothetical protein
MSVSTAAVSPSLPPAAPRALEVLRDALRAKRDACFKVTSRTKSFPQTTRLWLKEGYVVGVESEFCPEESLGRIMLDHGLIATEAYAAALDKLADEGPSVRLGEVLRKYNLCTTRTVELGLARQAEHCIVRCFIDETATIEEAILSCPETVPRVRVALGRLGQSYARRVDDFALEAFLAPVRHMFPRMRGSIADYLESSKGSSVSPDVEAESCASDWVLLLGSFRGTLPLSEICTNDIEQERMVVGLIVGGALEFSNTSKAIRITAESDDEISGLRSAEELQENLALARATSQAAQQEAAGSRGEAMGKNALGRVKLNRVTLSLRKVPEREPRDLRDARLLSELHFINASTLSRIGHWERAGKAFDLAADLLPSAEEYKVLQSRIAWKGATPELREQTREKAKELASAYALGAPWRHQTLGILGEVLLDEGLDNDAASAFESSLRWCEAADVQQRYRSLKKRIERDRSSSRCDMGDERPSDTHEVPRGNAERIEQAYKAKEAPPESPALGSIDSKAVAVAEPAKSAEITAAPNERAHSKRTKAPRTGNSPYLWWTIALSCVFIAWLLTR